MIGVATTAIPSIIPMSVVLAVFVDIVVCSGGRVAGGGVDSGKVVGSGEGSGVGSGEAAGSEFRFDVEGETPTVMFLTVSPLTVKLYSR